MQTIREIHDFNHQCIQETVDKKTVKFISPFMVADGINKNKRRYPFPILNKAVEEYNAKIQVGKGFGGAYHPYSGRLEIPDVSHRITKIFMKNKTAHVEGEILTDNEKGKKILSLIQAGSVLGLSARGFGTMKEKNGVNEIQPDYKMVGIDFVLSPSEDIAKVDQSNIFESAKIEKPKNMVSLIEFNDMVSSALHHAFYDLLPIPNVTKEQFEEYCNENWQKYADKVETILKKAGKVIEEPEQKQEKMNEEEILERQFEEAQLSGFGGSITEFKEKIEEKK